MPLDRIPAPKPSATLHSLAIILCLIASPALAEVAGPAKVIDGDTPEVQGQRIG